MKCVNYAFLIVAILTLTFIASFHNEKINQLNKKVAELELNTVKIDDIQLRASYVNKYLSNLDTRIHYLSIDSEHQWYVGLTTDEIDSIISISN